MDVAVRLTALGCYGASAAALAVQLGVWLLCTPWSCAA